MAQILDASALMVYLEKEPGYEKVTEAFKKASQAEKSILMTAVNWGEVLYITAKKHGLEEMEKLPRWVGNFPIEFISVDQSLAEAAGFYKASGKLPYVDGFAAALTKLHHGQLLTTDGDFRAVENQIEILWIR